MLCRMICLYHDGVQIEKDKLAESPSFTGNLVVEDWVDGSAFKRPVRYARLLSSDHLIPADISPPLFEPDIIKMTTTQMTLQGHQIGTRDGVSVHYVQAWVVRMTAPENA
jgi:hypothetical protein